MPLDYANNFWIIVTENKQLPQLMQGILHHWIGQEGYTLFSSTLISVV